MVDINLEDNPYYSDDGVFDEDEADDFTNDALSAKIPDDMTIKFDVDYQGGQ